MEEKKGMREAWRGERESRGREGDEPMVLCKINPRMEMPKTKNGRKRPTKALYLQCSTLYVMHVCVKSGL